MEPSARLLSLEGRRVVITGAAAGIGRAMALRFADAGAAVLLADIDAEGLDETIGLLPDGAPGQTAVRDLSQADAIDAFWAEVDDPIPDTLVNNAGTYPLRDYLEVDRAFLSRVLRVNMESVFWMCQRFIGRRRGQGGAIVNVASIETLVPFTEGLVPYSVSKAGVVALTRALAHDYGRYGFRVNAILPGGVRTPGTERLMRAAVRGLSLELFLTGNEFGARLPLLRWGEPDEVARVALFLASDLASYVQGAAIPVDGGFQLAEHPDVRYRASDHGATPAPAAREVLAEIGGSASTSTPPPQAEQALPGVHSRP